MQSHFRSFFYWSLYLTGALMVRLGRDVSTLSDGLLTLCFMGVFGFGFGGLVVAVTFGVSTGSDASSLFSDEKFMVVEMGALLGTVLMWIRSLEYFVPVASSCTVYDRCPSTEITVPLDHRAFFS